VSSEATTLSSPLVDNVRNISYVESLFTGKIAMPELHEIATLTSKGQIILPKSIRQALGAQAGAKLAFDLRGGEVLITRTGTGHEDPAPGAFLDLLEADIRAGKNIGTLPGDLVRAMLTQAGHAVDSDEEIAGGMEL
jgi:antitoxin PrlF